MNGDEREPLAGENFDLEGTRRNLKPRFGRIRRWLAKLWQGPDKPRQLNVTLFFERAQLFPEHCRRKLPNWVNALLLCAFWGLWFALNAMLSRSGYMAISELPGSHGPNDVVKSLTCGANRELWAGPYSTCGLDAEYCIDQVEGETLSFRCPANCGGNDGWTYSPWPVGNTTAMRVPLVVGGPEIYRGDSFICKAALHAGVISASGGGCGQLEWIGSHSQFPSTPSADGEFHSLEFDTEFPLNFRFVGPSENQGPSHCKDTRGPHMAVDVVMILIAAYSIPTSSGSPALNFFTLGVFGFWTVVLASNPPLQGGSPTANAEIFSLAIRRLLPCLLGLFFIYIVAARPQLAHMPASLSRAVFWGGGFVIGILENYVFGAIPIDRLMISDLNEQAGAWFALSILAIVLVFIVIGQAYSFWLMGEFRKYIKIYLGMIGALVALSLWPGQTLRLHHYFFALLLIPGTKPRTTCSLFFQGLLTGLFIAGVARWDFDSVLQTTSQLLRGDVLADLGHDPQLIVPQHATADNFVVSWTQKYSDALTNGYSLLINDVERVREIGAEPNANELVTHTFNLTQWVHEHFEDVVPDKWYIRVASAALESRRQARIGKYSSPLVVFSDGTYDLPA